MRQRYFQPYSTAAIFENPTNGWREAVPRRAWLWMLLFGVFYMAARSLWMPLGITLGILFVTTMVSWVFLLIVAPLVWVTTAVKARDMLEASYLRRGWLEIDPDNQ